VKRLLIGAIRFYQSHFSRYFAGSCIYQPSCSNYAIEAIIKHGSLKGVRMAASRLLRCHPPYEGGEDPVSQPKHS